ncbi:PorP/SprF family type IX secretion system membrane protein [Winogradskyella immobilis]|uniref:PorP/SprF family type IX secretion system membrane protein n=1 Tax=Winogradskyella immobilis TaxID=2816852 RepID=A0ABS8EMX3_9FLAO|nr:PorP/SprF family type IX secretion system membrane protein [Winogradskyella immobilis]MCC1484563.1 PorP/SprF family type IX secretion system membrane protein [Winogradskyella immobilis]MCG0016655.1 PorP/SprF family type IX secretion system membrane protein [Winogradskyella immobilis]
MKKLILHIVFYSSIIISVKAQDNGVASFSLPIRNSITFNKYAINPTFSFVREQYKYASVSNKRQWVEFTDAPQTYKFSYAGRLNENMGFGVGFFQQNFGLLNTFGGVLNYAYNVVLGRDSNLTFGSNLGFYNSGINEGRIITNTQDPLLNSLDSNLLITFNPGINYGTTFFDFGLVLNNFALYNFTTSSLVENDLEKGIQAHVMYTGFIDSYGFFDEAKFTGLLRSEFLRDNTILSTILMLTVPKGIWAQVGYNSLYGASGGLGLNITTEIAIEYNFEKTIGELIDFGPSHEITLAYRFKNKKRYLYSDDQELSSVISKNKFKKKSRIASKINAANRKNQPQSKKENTKNALVIKKEETTIVNKEENLKQQQDSIANTVKADIERKTSAKVLTDEKSKKIKTKSETQPIVNKETKTEIEVIGNTKNVTKTSKDEQVEVSEKENQIKENLFDSITKPIDTIRLSATVIKTRKVLSRIKETIAERTKDLRDLKEENDLGDQGIYKAPKPFKSLSSQEAKLVELRIDINNLIKSQDQRIRELKASYDQRLKNNSNQEDSIATIYLDEIIIIQSVQKETKRSLLDMERELEKIKLATDFERSRRIKRAAYDNQEDRYQKDLATLNRIKQTTDIGSETFNPEEFDFGEDQGSNIKILKDVKHTESGYYVVLAVHSDVTRRDEFIRMAITSGQSNIQFFFDLSTSNYYIYYEKFSDLDAATNALEFNNSAPYNRKRSIIKIEN